jgi:PAS domain S-box-containing protein
LLDKQQLKRIIAVQHEIARTWNDPGQVMNLIVARAEELTGADGAVIEFAEGDEMVYVAATGTAAEHIGIRLKSSASFSGLCVKEGSALLCDDAENDPRVDQEACRKVGVRSMVVVPLRRERKSIGALKVYSAKKGAFPEWSISLLELLGGFMGTVLDQAYEMKKLNQDLEDRIAKRTKDLRLLTDAIPALVSYIDSDERYQYVNAGYEDWYGKPRDSFIGTRISDIASPETYERNAPYLKAALAGETVRFETQVDHPHKGPMQILASYIPDRGPDGRVLGFVVLGLDVTEQKKMQAAESLLRTSEQAAIESSRLKSEFLANMSHEIRTPLHGMQGMTGMLLDTSPTPQQREYLEAILKSADSLLVIINSILDMSKIEAGRMEFEKIAYSPAQVARDAVDLLVPEAARKALSLALEFEDEQRLNQVALGDPAKIRQVILNLVSNAIKFTATGGVRLKVRPVSESRARFEVIDTGIGLNDGTLDKIFKPFAQADASTTRKHGGTGLGLSISKQLVELMGGTVGVSSQPGVGSTFWFELPVPPAPGTTAKTITSAVPHGELISLKGVHVLVVEDNAVNLKIAVAALGRAGADLSTALNGAEALTALQSNYFDVVLMDCQMPEMDGLEATRRIRADKDESRRSVPIIAMTTNAISGDRELCLQAGMNDYISKPMKLAELSRMVSKWAQISRKKKS